MEVENYNEIEVPEFDREKIAKSYLNGLSETEQDMVQSISLLDQSNEFLLRIVTVRNWQIKSMDARIRELEKTGFWLKVIIAVGSVVMPIVIGAATTYVMNKILGQ